VSGAIGTEYGGHLANQLALHPKRASGIQKQLEFSTHVAVAGRAAEDDGISFHQIVPRWGRVFLRHLIVSTLPLLVPGNNLWYRL